MLEPFEGLKDFFTPDPEPQKEFSVLEPRSWDDYVPVARWLIYRNLLIALLILLCLLLAGIAIWFLWPRPAPVEPGIPVYYYQDELLKLYSGEVILTNESDKVIYRGQVQNGLRSGWGKSLFSFNGAAQYEGEFRGDFYEGQGALFDYNGELQYEGQFQNGLFHGYGTLFEKGRKKYAGGFANGLPDGEGVLYGESGETRYQGGFARGFREGLGLETDAEGFPVYEGAFREDMYDGRGVLYTRNGSQLRFEGTFIRGKPAREGKIYNPQGQILYDGTVFDGEVDCVNLLGLGVNDWEMIVKEKPVIYFGGGYVGYLYGELGLAAIGLYSVESPDEAADSSHDYEDGWEYPDDENLNGAEDGAFAQEDPPPFSDSDITLYTILVSGRYAEQLSLDDGAQFRMEEITGFEAFMSSRLAAINDPAAKSDAETRVKRVSDDVYEAEGLPDTVNFDGDCVYRDLIYYYSEGEDLSKGGVPDVIHCRKKQFGG